MAAPTPLDDLSTVPHQTRTRGNNEELDALWLLVYYLWGMTIMVRNRTNTPPEVLTFINDELKGFMDWDESRDINE